MKNQKGITLVAMVVTIAVMIILAGVSINVAIGNNGIISNSDKAIEKNTDADAKSFILEAWGYTLAKFENIDNMEIDNLRDNVFPYFNKYMSVYAKETSIDRNDETSSVVYKVKYIAKGKEVSLNYYIVDNREVLTEKEFKDFKRANPR